MSKILEFSNIEKENIFTDDFRVFDKNNILDFESKQICVLYAPNGTGKTSFVKVLSQGETNTKFKAHFNFHEFSESDNDLFHIINDQLSRNVIKGETDEFLIGDNIRKEKELKKLIDSEFEKLFKTDLPELLKTELFITTKTSKLLTLLDDDNMIKISSDLANTKSKGSEIDQNAFLGIIENLTLIEVAEYNHGKYEFFLKDFQNSKSIIKDIESLAGIDFTPCTEIRAIEQYDYAIGTLGKFSHVPDCIVCDTKNINHEQLITHKRTKKTTMLNSLDANTRKVLEKILEDLKSEESDPFQIKKSIFDALNEGDKTYINLLLNEFLFYKEIFKSKINNLYYERLSYSILPSKYQELKEFLEQKPEIQEEDLLLIKSIIQNTIGKEIDLDRDQSKNLVIKFDNDYLLDKKREDLHLSTGEQNYLSLSFELLKAKNQSREIIVLDDPISSFDSIFKNKIAYSIMKILENKKVLILTHTTDLIKLLEHQKQNSFNLYLFNNSENEENGFIPVKEKEQDILLYLDKLLNLFRKDVLPEITNPKNFLISLIPFMRSYANIINKKTEKDKLQRLMHGYEVGNINITDIYKELFGDIGITEDVNISVNDILQIDISNLEILKNENYPLLNKTLRHSLCYLYLRLLVEKKISILFEIDTSKDDLLTKIIFKAFKDDKYIKERVFYTSRKTLLNEFNHFEGNMNIFQPAIDINDTSLNKEITEIIQHLNSLIVKL